MGSGGADFNSTANRPFRVEDFRDALEEVGMLPAVVDLGAVTLNSGEATKRLTALKELLVKGRRCLVIDPQEQQVKIRLHWLLHGVADEDVRTALAAFGKVEASQHCDGPNEAAAAPESWADCGRESASRQDEQDANQPEEDAPVMKDAVRGDSVSARVKRPLKASTQKCDGNLAIEEGEPPAKTPPVRRTCEIAYAVEVIKLRFPGQPSWGDDRYKRARACLRAALFPPGGSR
ncbi:hypothetical protein HPB50_017923 [Hyalomma asiaticum]|uniref:Uncharacterized protein n=1 Tax=Hyalomma asiaticum TaxID=266040 RepID=A0ACB7T1M8_HYAAI|nr:hypothetical protein HPB50_017923 [Hyalomma asiaticum]